MRESVESSLDVLAAYTATLATKAPGTVDLYTRILRQFTAWLAARPGSSGTFQPDQLTVTALDMYLKEREASGVSISHRTRIKTVVGNFARYLIEEHGVLRRNPARSVHIGVWQRFAIETAIWHNRAYHQPSNDNCLMLIFRLTKTFPFSNVSISRPANAPDLPGCLSGCLPSERRGQPVGALAPHPA